MSIYGPKIKTNLVIDDSLINKLNTLIQLFDNSDLDPRKSKSSEPKQLKLNDQPVNSGGLQPNTAKSYINNI